MIKIKNNPHAIIGKPVSTITNYDWDECYPVVSNGVVVGVQTGEGDVLAGVAGKFFDDGKEWFQVEPLALPSGLTSESAQYAKDGPQEQVIASLRSIIARCEAHGSLEATELAQEAQEALDEMDA